MVGPGWFRVLEFVEGCCDISRNGECDPPTGIVPIQMYAAIDCSFPICGNGIVLSKTCNKMFGMLLSDIFDAKIIHHQGECDWPCLMFPKARCVAAREVTMCCESFG